MYRLSHSAAFLAQSCKFTCGQGDVTDMMDIPTPVPEPLETPETRRPRHPTSTATSSSQPPTTQPATTQPATTQPTTTQPAASQAVVASGAAAPASQPEALQDDCRMGENQCYCGQFFESDDAKKDHLAIIHAGNTWACGGRWTNNVGVEVFVHTWQKIDSNCGLISEKSTKRNTNTIAQSQVTLLAQMNNG